MKAKIWNKSWWITEVREKALDAMFDRMAKAAGFNVIDVMEYEFTPFGYTKLYLLSESHLALHSFPEEGKTYVELSSCNEEYFNAFTAMMEA